MALLFGTAKLRTPLLMRKRYEACAEKRNQVDTIEYRV